MTAIVQLVENGAADGSPRDLAWLAGQPVALSEIVSSLSEIERAVLPEAIRTEERAIVPICELRPDRQSEAETKVGDWLRPIGIKVAPTMASDQATAWRKAMVMALSDLPPRIAISATKAAMHKPMQFLNEVEGIIREIAAVHLAEHSLALRRLRNMQEEIARASKPKLVAPEGFENGPAPLSAEELARTPAHILRMGLTAGHITQEEFDAAIARREPDDVSEGRIVTPGSFA